MTKEEIQYEAQSIIQEFGSNDSAPYVEFVEKLASMELPEPPSNLDEAVEEIASDIAPTYPDVGWDECFEKIKEGIKAGAEWMAGQGETHELTVESPVLGPPMICCPVHADNGDKVVVQIRNK